MRIGALINLMAETYGIPPETVTLVARALREAGWLTTGARGVNAPEMTPRDAARLTLALLSGAPPGKVVEEFEFLRGLEAKEPFPDSGFTAGSGLDQSHTLEEVLIWLFGLTWTSPNVQEYKNVVGSWELWPQFKISVDSSVRAAEVSLPDHYSAYEDLAAERELAELDSVPFSLEKSERTFELMDRSSRWDSSTIPGRAMRMIRTLDSYTLSKINEAIAATSPTAAE